MIGYSNALVDAILSTVLDVTPIVFILPPVSTRLSASQATQPCAG